MMTDKKEESGIGQKQQKKKKQMKEKFRAQRGLQISD